MEEFAERTERWDGVESTRPAWTGDVVVGVDGSTGSSDALIWSWAEAVRRQTSLRVVRVFPTEGAKLLSTEALDLEASVRRQVEDALVIDPHGPSIKVEAIGGGPVRQLLAIAESDGVMLVVGSRGLCAVASQLLGSVSRQCVRDAQLPVVVYRRGPTAKGPVVVGIDGSAASDEALLWGIAEAQLRHVGVEALHAWTYPAAYRNGAAILPFAAMASRANRVLEHAVRRLELDGCGVEINSVACEGKVVDCLVEASERASLLVLGEPQHLWLDALHIGSVVGPCLARAESPVAVIHRRQG